MKWAFSASSTHEENKKDDDRQWDAEKPEQYAASHGEPPERTQFVVELRSLNTPADGWFLTPIYLTILAEAGWLPTHPFNVWRRMVEPEWSLKREPVTGVLLAANEAAMATLQGASP